MDFINGIVRLVSLRGETIGTGFLVSKDGHVATVAHVLKDANIQPDSDVELHFLADNQQLRYRAKVVSEWWRDPKGEDIAILKLNEKPPSKAQILPLGPTKGTREFVSFGFPSTAPLTGNGARGIIITELEFRGAKALQLNSNDVTVGFSGAPVWDEKREIVVGVIKGFPRADQFDRQKDVNYARPAELYSKICPELPWSDPDNPPVSHEIPAPDAMLKSSQPPTLQPVFLIGEKAFQETHLDLGTSWGLTRASFIGLIAGGAQDDVFNVLVYTERTLFDAIANGTNWFGLNQTNNQRLAVRWWMKAKPEIFPNGPNTQQDVWKSAENSPLVRFLSLHGLAIEATSIIPGIFFQVPTADFTETKVTCLCNWCIALTGPAFATSQVAIVIQFIGSNIWDNIAKAQEFQRQLEKLKLSTPIEIMSFDCDNLKTKANYLPSLASRRQMLIKAMTNTQKLDEWIQNQLTENKDFLLDKELYADPIFGPLINELALALLRQYRRGQHHALIKKIIEEQLMPKLNLPTKAVCKLCLGDLDQNEFLTEYSADALMAAIRAKADLVFDLNLLQNHLYERPEFWWWLHALPPEKSRLEQLLTFPAAQRVVLGLCADTEWEYIAEDQQVVRQIEDCRRDRPLYFKNKS